MAHSRFALLSHFGHAIAKIAMGRDGFSEKVARINSAGNHFARRHRDPKEDHRWNSLGSHRRTNNRDHLLSADLGSKEFASKTSIRHKHRFHSKNEKSDAGTITDIPLPSKAVTLSPRGFESRRRLVADVKGRLGAQST